MYERDQLHVTRKLNEAEGLHVKFVSDLGSSYNDERLKITFIAYNSIFCKSYQFLMLVISNKWIIFTGIEFVN